MLNKLVWCLRKKKKKKIKNETNKHKINLFSLSETRDVIKDMVMTNLEEKMNGRNNKHQGT
jgi:hypothetical protein